MAKRQAEEQTIDPITWEIFPIDREKDILSVPLEAGECLFIVVGKWFWKIIPRARTH